MISGQKLHQLSYLVLQAQTGKFSTFEIRYIDFEKNIIEGDHLMWSLEEAYEYAFRDYGIREADWRHLSKVEIEKVECGMG